ncbi:TPA: antirestriction protein ArdA, partial [Legionella pneumophila]|nr:antirestriction protein ArdA [Legionella pneumophila]
MDTPQIYIACLAAYNNGILHGEWIDATQDVSTIYNEIHEMLANSPIEDAEEFAIHDFEGFGGTQIGEYDSINDVAELAFFIMKHG